ncbi:expressed protein [Phakopsora pachyrhizi]|uniref:Expressed protein n=1 Tax=Phakopsora pachyrhizi TaxID=170000 RepID=A0AAV0AGZ7_PHAPC|nr:expressed protein [Phakopsora pachyrhizi]
MKDLRIKLIVISLYLSINLILVSSRSSNHKHLNLLRKHKKHFLLLDGYRNKYHNYKKEDTIDLGPNVIRTTIRRRNLNLGGQNFHEKVPINEENRSREAVSELMKTSFFELKSHLRGISNKNSDALKKCLERIQNKQQRIIDDEVQQNCNGLILRTSYGIQSLVNLVLEQFVGIFTPIMIGNVLTELSYRLDNFKAENRKSDDGGKVFLVSKDFGNLEEILKMIRLSILSVSSSVSGNSVTGIERLESCAIESYKKHLYINKLSSKKIDLKNIKTLMGLCRDERGDSLMDFRESVKVMVYGVIEQFVGILPSSMMKQLYTILDRYIISSTQKSKNSDRNLSFYPDDFKSFGDLEQSLRKLSNSFGPETVTLVEDLINKLSQKLN